MKERLSQNVVIHNRISKTYNSSRFIELDILRGFAIILMIFLHILWDLDYFGLLPLNKDIYQIQKFVPALFFILLGTCLIVSKNRKMLNPKYNNYLYNKHLVFRGLKILGCGIAISIVTLIFIPDRPIFFGVLHCIGLSLILSIPFVRFKSYNILFALIILISSLFIGNLTLEDPSIFHLAIGIHYSNIAQHTVDYFPLIPWFGFCLLGIALGNIFYKDNKRQFNLPDISRYKSFTVFSWLGKHSLAIYLFHQPIIAGALSLIIIL